MNKIPEYIGILNKRNEWKVIISNLIPEYKGIYLNASPSSPQPENDHRFIVVDLVKVRAEAVATNGITAIVPFTAEAAQTVSTQFIINAVPTAVTINQETASNVALTATNITVNEETASSALTVTNITVNEEVYTNVNA